MKHREPPSPVNFKRPLPKHLQNDAQVRKWAKRLLGDPEARPRDLTQEQLAFVTLEVAKRRADAGFLDPGLLVKAMAETTPVISAPKMERLKLAEDLELIWSQPEMRMLWDSWDGKRGSAGPPPDYLTGKGMATVMGMTGISAHADDCFAELTGNEKIWQLFERLDNLGARRPRSYENATRQLPRLAAHDAIVRTNVQMIKELAALFPSAGIGQRLMIDGSARPAWCAQAPTGKTDEQEAHRRRMCPEAGSRAIIHTSGGKRTVKSTEMGRGQSYLAKGKHWRGYHDVVIADMATLLPVVWGSFDASLDEAAAIVVLMSDLARFWGEDFSPEAIVGDSAWDEDPWCRMLEVDYGTHPVFRLHAKDKFPKVGSHSRDETVASITEYGQLVCAAHGRALPMLGSESGPRIGEKGEPLRPGQTADERSFRVRATCAKGCGKLSLQMKADWSRLTHYPHHGIGGKAIKWRYAMREAMLARLAGMEGIWQRLQSGKKVSTDDADRTRIRDKDGHDLILDLAMLSMTAASLTDERRQRGISVPPLPPAPPAPIDDLLGGGGGGSKTPKSPNGAATSNGNGAVPAGNASTTPANGTARATASPAPTRNGHAGRTRRKTRLRDRQLAAAATEMTSECRPASVDASVMLDVFMELAE